MFKLLRLYKLINMRCTPPLHRYTNHRPRNVPVRCRAVLHFITRIGDYFERKGLTAILFWEFFFGHIAMMDETLYQQGFPQNNAGICWESNFPLTNCWALFKNHGISFGNLH